MRKDFIKVLTERPRSKGRDHEREKRRPIGEDDAGYKEGMRKPYADRKSFTDLIGPLYRFLQSRTGKPWSKVHSEICKELKGRSTQQQHLLDHLDRAVETKLYAVGRKLYEADGKQFTERYSRQSFYVDPRDGLLKATKFEKSWWRRPKPKDPTTHKADGRDYRRINGIWFEITTVSAPVWVPVGLDTGRWAIQHVEHKRSLSSKELKTLALGNVDEPEIPLGRPRQAAGRRS